MVPNKKVFEENNFEAWLSSLFFGKGSDVDFSTVIKKLHYLKIPSDTCGLYYKCLTIVIYDRNDIGLYYKTRDNRN